jgi:hypothetical protein
MGLPPLTVPPIFTVTEFAVSPTVALTPVGTPGAVVAVGAATVILWVAWSVPALATMTQSPVASAITRPVAAATEQTLGDALA